MKFLMWKSLERWYSFAAWLINRLWFYAEYLIRSCWFRCKHYWIYLYCANLGDIDVSLMLRRWFVDDPLKRHFETLIISMETFLVFIVFDVLTSESFMFHCSFSDDSLMILLRNIDDTTKIWMQTLKITEFSNMIIIRTMIFFCCLID